LLSTGLTYSSSIIPVEETADDDEEDVKVADVEFDIGEGDTVEDDKDEFEDEEDDENDDVVLDDVDFCMFDVDNDVCIVDVDDDEEDDSEVDDVELVCTSSLALQTNFTRGCTLNTYQEIQY